VGPATVIAALPTERRNSRIHRRSYGTQPPTLHTTVRKLQMNASMLQNEASKSADIGRIDKRRSGG
jgi:hypothetical protein